MSMLDKMFSLSSLLESNLAQNAREFGTYIEGIIVDSFFSRHLLHCHERVYVTEHAPLPCFRGGLLALRIAFTCIHLFVDVLSYGFKRCGSMIIKET